MIDIAYDNDLNELLSNQKSYEEHKIKILNLDKNKIRIDKIKTILKKIT